MYKKLKCLLDARGISTYRLSKDTGINQASFSDWKSGRSKPKLDKLKILANYFNVPIDYFLD